MKTVRVVAAVIKAVNEKLKKLEKVLIYFSILRFIIVILCIVMVSCL